MTVNTPVTARDNGDHSSEYGSDMDLSTGEETRLEYGRTDVIHGRSACLSDVRCQGDLVVRRARHDYDAAFARAARRHGGRTAG